ncbi:MAG: RNA polymerase sigma factor SigJ [Candidatus Eremiobacteraeota bacterium]|nr:RNA polymerase sigma factor SigJ [Candidatus Eremiobacteraeota bacterium]MBV8644960.1 RNA polymerase sigma factor SigJ [Candidatus Eremiobacteraeota bacterium]
MSTDEDAVRFEAHRATLNRLAYRMLGSNAEAEDIVQDAYLRFADALRRTTVADDAAYLRATVTRLALDRLRSARARRETYVGPWLPEPIVSDEAGNPEATATLADDVSFALMLALERLSPLERAAFILHDVLDVPFAEIASTLHRSEEAARRLASRGREHVRESRTRRSTRRADAIRLRDAFTAALLAGDVDAVIHLLTDDVVLLSDGGGKATAAINPVVGADHVARFLVGVATKGAPYISRIVPALLNGDPGYVIFGDEHRTGEEAVVQTLAIETDGERINAIYVTRNPDKLRGVAARLGDAPR